MANGRFGELVGGNVPTLVDFSAAWCGPCKMMAPILAELKQHTGDRVRIITIDIDRNPGLAQSYAVQSVPTLVLFKNGTVAWRQSGVVLAEPLKAIIDQHL